MRLPEPYHSMLNKIRPGDLAIDCGANIGNITELLAERGAVVHAFEPNPHAFALLEHRFRNQDRVVCYNKGVWVEKRTLPLYLHRQSDEDPLLHAISSSIYATKFNVDPDKYVEIETIDLTEFIVGLQSRISFLKIDVEGAEFDLLQKLIITGVYAQIDLIAAETHEDRIPELKPKATRLRELIDEHQISSIWLNWN